LSPCHVGAASLAESVVRCVCEVPEAVIVKTSLSPSRLELNAMEAPSGDQAGAVSEPLEVVRRVCDPPVEDIV
jgi:hypothetical protein